jgi:hypothetical protein
MSHNREEIIHLRNKLLRGDPPYLKDAMGALTRERGGTQGLHELQVAGDFSPIAPTVRMMLDTQIKVLDLLLEIIDALGKKK